MAKTIEECLEEIRKSGDIPLGMVAFNVETDQFTFYVLQERDLGEVNALFQRMSLNITPVKER